MLFFYIRTTLRNIGRQKTASILSAAGLGLGICVLLFSIEYHSFQKGYNQWHTHLDHLYRANILSVEGKSPETFPALAPLMEVSIPGVRKAVRFGDNFNDGAIISYTPINDPSLKKSFRDDACVFADAAFLDAFSFPLEEGSNQLSKTNTAVITHTLATKLFGKEQAVGKTLQLHNQFGNLNITVSGVISDIPAQSDIKFDCLLSMEILKNPGYTEGSDWARPDSWGNQSYTTYVWLDDKFDPVSVGEKATSIWRSRDPDYTKEKGVIQLQPISEIHLGSSMHDNNPKAGSLATVNFILAIGILVCCIGWINYINFSTAFAISQAKQIGIHKIVGSTRWQIVGRYIIESFILNVLGLSIAILMTIFLQPFFNRLAGSPLSLNAIGEWSAFIMGAAVMLVGITVCGAYVGFSLARFRPVAMMHFNDVGNKGNALLRKGLVVFQFFVSIAAIAATMIMFRQVDFMRHQDLGMDINKLMVIPGPAIRDSAFKVNSILFKNELSRLSFVERMSSTGSIPGEGFAHNFGADGITGSDAKKGDERKQYFISEIDEHYFPTYKIPIYAGLNFSDADAQRGQKNDKLILNETAARQLGYEPGLAVGRVVNWGRQYRIVGVVKDYHHRSLKDKIEPIIYLPQAANSWYTVQVGKEHLTDKIAAIRAIYQRMYPGNPFEYNMLKDTYDHLYAEDEREGQIALTLSILVIIICCIGLTGLSIFNAKRRNKEISIRKVLGAGSMNLYGLLSAEFLWLVLIAFLLATPVTIVYMFKWLNGFAYRIDFPWYVFLVTLAIMVFIAAATVSIQSLKAAVANPIDGLRSE